MQQRPVLSSPQNPRFRAALALREAPERRERRLFLVDGAREIGRAIGAHLRMREAWVAPERIRSDVGRSTLAAAAGTGAPLVEAAPELLARLAYGDRDEGLVAVFEMPETTLDRLALPSGPLVAVVVGVEKPGNLGAILRSADGAGVDAVMVADPRCDPWNPNAIRASSGAVFSVPLAVCDAPNAIAWLREHGLRVVAARPDGVTDHAEADLRGGVAIVLGSEAAGLDEAWQGPDIEAVRIPMLGVGDSLNVSTTAAILFYEAHRQRRDPTRSKERHDT